jgi:thioester reductase-like protein
MQYFITGASGFIGRRLVKKLLAREDSTIYFLVRAAEKESLANLYDFWECDAKRAIPVVGDLTEPLLGVAAVDRKKLGKKTTHFFHLAAIYDLSADADIQLKVNVEGTRNTVNFAEEIGAKHFHLFSSIASAGMFEGLFREDMFEEAEGLDHPISRPSMTRKASFAASAAFPGASTARPLSSAIRAPAKWTRSTALTTSSN